MKKAPDGRYIHHWVGKDRTADSASLAATIAEAVDGLCNYDGTLAWLDENGGLNPVNLAGLQDLIGKKVCGMRIIPNGSGWQREFYSYAFEPAPRPDPALAGRSLPPQPAKTTTSRTTEC
jgi:hypothetical protein